MKKNRNFKSMTQELKYLKNLLEALPGDIYWKDLSGKWLGVNKQGEESLIQMGFIKNRDDVIGKNDFELFNKETAEEYRRNDLEVIETKHTILHEEVIKLPNGEKITQLSTKKPIIDDNKKIVGIVGNTINISYLKSIEEELYKEKIKAEAANHAKTEFIANMSHDIRTPLTGVIGISDILEKLEANPELKQYAHDIHDCGQQLLAMLNSILDVVSADHLNEHDKIIETFNLVQCIQDIIHLEKPTTALKKLTLNIQIDPNIPTHLMNDKTKIHRILLNLFSNAVKFTEVGSITLSTHLLNIQNNQATVRFSITDTGIGIPEDQQAKVFDRFFRASPSYKGQYTGHGVGLHIAQSYAKLLGSEIKIISQEGLGTTFSLDITSPISSEIPEKNPEITSEPSLSANTKHLTCLLVEDNPTALKILESMISSAGIQYTSQIDGESALETAKKQPFDFIITDLGLPGISGHEFAKLYRQWETYQQKPPIPIFALTAHAQDDVISECQQAGMNEVFFKPFSSDVLKHIISNYVQTKPPDNLSIIPKTSNQGKLGRDLPDSEEQLFQLDTYPLFDVQRALEFVGQDKITLKNILEMMVQQEIPQEKAKLESAYSNHNWDDIEKLAHKIKGGAVYIGAEKLKFACQYLERYRKAGHDKSLQPLYLQMMQVIEKTRSKIIQWLKSSK